MQYNILGLIEKSDFNICKCLVINRQNFRKTKSILSAKTQKDRKTIKTDLLDPQSKT